MFCAKQELALRGHRESAISQNRGNFLELLSLVALHDPIIKEMIQEGPRNPNTHLRKSRIHFWK